MARSHHLSHHRAEQEELAMFKDPQGRTTGQGGAVVPAQGSREVLIPAGFTGEVF